MTAKLLAKIILKSCFNMNNYLEQSMSLKFCMHFPACKCISWPDLMSSSRKYPSSSPQKGLEFNLKKCMKLIKIFRGVGHLRKTSFHGGGMAIIWNYTIDIQQIFFNILLFCHFSLRILCFKSEQQLLFDTCTE